MSLLKKFGVSVAVIVVGGLSQTASALMLESDDFVALTTTDALGGGNGIPTEQDWVRTFNDYRVDPYKRLEDSELSIAGGGADGLAWVEIDPISDWFVLRTHIKINLRRGNRINETFYVLFDNRLKEDQEQEQRSYAVFNLVDLGGILAPEVGMEDPIEIAIRDIKHVSFDPEPSPVNERPAPVPEPGMLSLLGAGLLALGFARRRKMHN